MQNESKERDNTRSKSLAVIARIEDRPSTAGPPEGGGGFPTLHVGNFAVLVPPTPMDWRRNLVKYGRDVLRRRRVRKYWIPKDTNHIYARYYTAGSIRWEVQTSYRRNCMRGKL